MNSAFLQFGRPLTDFESNNLECIFPPCPNQIPKFLMENLMDDYRVIKLFRNDCQAHLRIFYYQYLKLCFELDQTDYESYINKIQELLINPFFKFYFPENEIKNINQTETIYQDLQFKRFIIQFMEILDDDDVCIQTALSRFPIMDQVFISLFRSVLISNNKCQGFNDQIPREQLFQFLASYFGVDIALYENCLKFIDSDVFIYEENPNEVYMIYIDYQEKDQSHPSLEASSEKNLSSVKQIVSNNNFEDMKAQVFSKQQKSLKPNNVLSTPSNQNDTSNSGIYQFIDYTHCKKSQPKIPTVFEKEQENYPTTTSNYEIKTKNHSQNNSFGKDIKNNEFISILDNKKNSQAQISNSFNPISYQYTNENNSTLSKNIPTKFDQYTYTNIHKNDNQDLNIKPTYQSFLKKDKKDFKINQGEIDYGAKILNTFQKNSHILSQVQTAPSTRGYTFDIPQATTCVSMKKSVYQEYISTVSLKESLDIGQSKLWKGAGCLSNISKQFTDSIMLKNIKQPYQTNISMMKVRARAQRSALSNSPLLWK